MNKKNAIKILITLLIVLLGVSTISFADYTPVDFGDDIDTGGTGTSSVITAGGKIVGLIQVVGTIVSVGMIIVLGIKYMVGSAEERAEYKKSLMPYLIGAVLIFASSNLAQIVYDWANSIQ